MNRITLVTGGAGFIGSHIVSELLRREESVRTLDNLSTGYRENLAEFGDRIDQRDGDLNDFAAVKAALVGVADVLHIGALGSVPRSIDDPISTNESNVAGTLNVLQAARLAGVRRVVFSSSSSVYGDTEVLPKVESMRPNPRSPYAASKLACEAYCSAFNSSMGLETVVLRYFNVFGPRQNPNSQYAAVVPKFIRSMTRGEQPVIFGDGHQSRDFTYIENIVNGTILARDSEGAGGGTFNLACSGSHTILELVELINRYLGTSLEPIHQEARAGDVRHSYADITAASAWGYEPTVGFADGVEKTVAYFTENRE